MPRSGRQSTPLGKVQAMRRLSLTLSVLAAVLAIQFGNPAHAGDGGRFAKRLSAAETGGPQVQSPGPATEPGDAAPMERAAPPMSSGQQGDKAVRSMAEPAAITGGIVGAVRWNCLSAGLALRHDPFRTNRLRRRQPFFRRGTIS